MNKPGGPLESFKQSYEGSCSACSESYVLKAQDDNLEGVIFPCKKIGCSGKVSLKVEDEFKASFAKKKPVSRSKFH